jgi:thioesterase domain-containing protein/acyl carrier protein
VKIRGNRVELGEIQTILRAIPGVAEVLVVAEPRTEGDPRLVAYWVGTARREHLVEAARRHLPGYMVPASYVLLDAFPLNTNGKIDRARLPLPETLRDLTVPPALARNDTETRIAAVWRDVLGVPVIPRNEDFFLLGGSSVLATQVVLRLEQELGVEIPLAGFFQAPTVEGMAARLGDGAARDEPIIVWLRHGPRDRAPLFCLFGVHLYQDLALALHEDRPVIAAHVPFRYVPGRDTRPSLGEIATRYVEIIRNHQAHGPYDLLGLCFGGIVAYEVARQLEAAGERVANVAVIDAILPNAVRVDTARRLRAYVGSAQKALREPHDLERWLRKGGEALAARVPLLGKLKQVAAAVTNGVKPIDLPIDGPEVEAEVRRFASAASRLAARLLIVRALGEQTPDWMAVDATHGWARRAKEVRVHDIQADHLGVLRDPHVRSLARALVE